jgi:hypothetical protein
MRRTKECDCNRVITNYKSVKFEINESNIVLKCIICNGLIGWLVGWANKEDSTIKEKMVSR